MEPMETMYSPTYLPGRQFSHGPSAAIYESPLDLSINTVQHSSTAMIPDPENISLPHGGRFLVGQPGSSSGAFRQAHLMYPNVNGSNDTFQQSINFDVHSSRRMPVLFPYGHPPSSLSVSQNRGIVFNQNSYAQHMPSSLGTTNHRVDIQVNGQHMSSWTAKKDAYLEDQGSRNGPKNLRVYHQHGQMVFSSPPNNYGLSSTDPSVNILNSSQVYNTNRLSPLVLPSAVAPSPLPHIRKKEGADGNQKDSPRTARDFPDQPGQTVSFPRASCTTTNIENVITIDGGDIGSTKALNSSQHGSHIYVSKNGSYHVAGDVISKCMLSSSQMMPSPKRTREGYLKEPLNSCQSYSPTVVSITENVDTNSITTMPRLKAVSPSGHRNSTENSTSPLGPPPLIAAVDSTSGTARVQEQNADVPKLLPQVFQWHNPPEKPICSNSTAMLIQNKCSYPLSESNCSTSMPETLSVVLENKPHMFQQGEQLSVVLQVPTSVRNTSSPRQEDCRKRANIVPLVQSTFFCNEQKFTVPVPMDNVINKQLSSCNDVPLFGSQVHSVWGVSQGGEVVNNSKSFLMESAGISTVQLDCRPYYNRIKTEKCIPVERETASASCLEDSKPVMMETIGPPVFHNLQTESFQTTAFCHYQDKKKLDPIVIETSEASNSVFNNSDFKNYQVFPSCQNENRPVTTHNTGLVKFELNDKTHLISSLTSKNTTRGHVLTYAEIHPVPKEFLESHKSTGIDFTGSTHEQSNSFTQPHLVEPVIKKEPIEGGLNGIFNDGNTNNDETSMPLSKEEYSVSSMGTKSVTSLVGEIATASMSSASPMAETPSPRKSTASSVAENPPAIKLTVQSPGVIKTPPWTGKQENYVPCERIQEHKALPVITDHTAESDPSGNTWCALKRKLCDLQISASSISHTQPKRPKECIKTSRSHIQDRNFPHTARNVLEEQSLLHRKDCAIQIPDVPEKAVDVSLDCERSRRTTFIDFKPEVLESRTRHQKSRNGKVTGRKGKRRLAGKTRRRPKRTSIHNKVSRIIKGSPNDKNSLSEAHQASCSGHKNGTQPDLPVAVCEKDQELQVAPSTSSRVIQDTDVPSHDPPTNIVQVDEEVKRIIRHHSSRRRRLKSGLDMIRKKKPPVSKKKIFPSVLKDLKRRKKPEINDLKKLVVNKSLGESALHRAARQGNLEMVQLCLNSKFCAVNSSDNAGYSPLHEACSKGHLEIARMLLQHDADANACATGGVRPIHDAVENDHVEIVRLLLSYGADPTISTYSGRTLASYVKSQKMSEFLRGFYSDVGYLNSAEFVNALPSTSSSTWSFAGSASCLDPAVSGYDVCFISSSNTPSPKDDDPGFLFETSETNFVPTFLYSLSPSEEPEKFVLFQDVLRHLQCNEAEFALNCPDITIISVSRHDFQARSVCCQVLSNPEIPQSMYNVQIILYTEQVRSILNIENMFIVL